MRAEQRAPSTSHRTLEPTHKIRGQCDGALIVVSRYNGADGLSDARPG
jgi:hypothetical protein